MGVRVLLIEDDETIAEPLADGLRHFGLTVHHVATGADGLRGPHGDVVLLDLGLPDMDGIDVCRGIRRTSDVPIIILSARGEEADRVLGLELGADDYLAKPFSIRELVARIRAVSRRHQRPGGGAVPGVVAGVVVAEAGAGADVEGGAGIGVDAGSGAYAQRPPSAQELAVRRESATGGGLGVPAGVPAGVGGRSRIGFGTGSDFTAASDFGGGSDRGAVDDLGAGDVLGAVGSGRAGDDGSGRTGLGDAGDGDGVGDGDAGRRRAGFGVGADGSEYDWSAAYKTPPQGEPAHGASRHGASPHGESTRRAPDYETWAHTAQSQATPAHGTPMRGTPFEGTSAHGTPTAPGDPAWGSPAFGGTPAQGTPPHGSPMYGTPAHGSPAFGSPAYGTPAHGSPVYEQPPVYEPPMYEQVPPQPRTPVGPAADDDGSAPPPPGPLVVDRRTRQVWVGEVPVALTPKEFELLALLTEDPGAVYSRQQILNRVWDDHYHGPTKTLDVHVATLRRKLGDPAWIQTLRGVGFRLAVRTPGQAPGPGQGQGQGQPQGRGQGPGPGRGRGQGSGRHRTPEARAS
ncbi:winged helix-turn-helix domain-containing protein [Streptomyces europaeiscabiei]|uniref:winged helix-turn-helix domain-containing protein n=1 Tax=Streptomyces europaeiscabiei TaxID=146819 RepID=UPI0038D37550